MKNFNQFILTLLAAGLLASCSLTEEPTSFVNRKSFYKNESQCIAALNSCYMPANAIYTANFMLVTEACTDIWYSSSTTVDAWPRRDSRQAAIRQERLDAGLQRRHVLQRVRRVHLVRRPGRRGEDASGGRSPRDARVLLLCADLHVRRRARSTPRWSTPTSGWPKSAACPEPRPMKSARSCTMTWSGTHCRGSPPRTAQVPRLGGRRQPFGLCAGADADGKVRHVERGLERGAGPPASP